MNYTVRYATLNSNRIYNWGGPGYGKHWVSPEERRHLQEWHVRNRNKRDGFYDRLEKSILKEGIRNPIVVNSGYIHPSKWRNLPPHITKCGLENFLACLDWGASRLYIAQKYNWAVPCVIVDYSGKFSTEQELKTEKDILAVYRDKPLEVKFGLDRLFLKMDTVSWKK